MARALPRASCFPELSMPRLLILTLLLMAADCHVPIGHDAALASEFGTLVRPFLTSHCVDCHGDVDAEANVSLGNLTDAFETNPSTDVWQRVLEQITLGRMPPADQDRPAPGEVKQVAEWIRAQFESNNITPEVDHKLRSPQFGNHVNHAHLFDGSHIGPAASPSRLWRISPHIYDQFVDRVDRGLRREMAIHQPFPLDESKGQLANYAAQQFAASATLELMMMNCDTIVDFQTTGVLRRDHQGKTQRMRRTPEPFEQILDSAGEIPLTQIRAAIAYQFDLLLERPPTSEEFEQLTFFFRKAVAIGGNVQGLQSTLKAILLKPEAVYRMEIGLGEIDSFGRRRLSDIEVAYALAYGLTDKGPTQIRVQLGGPDQSESPTDDHAGQHIDEDNGRTGGQTLIELAEAGELASPQQIQRVVKQLLDDNNMSVADYTMFAEDHRIRNARVLRFFREFFGYHHAPKVFKDEKRIGFGDRYATRRIVNDADQLVMHIFDQDEDVLYKLLTTDKYFVAYCGSLEKINKDLRYIKTNVNDANFEFNTQYVQKAEAAGRHPIPIEGPSTRMYVEFYNLPHETWDYPTTQPFRMPGGQRTGLLTHPAWLIAWGGNFDNDPIRRGKWIREHLLAGTVPDVPLTVNAVVPENPHQTLRERLSVTRAEYCWQCHQKMDPLGLPFEQFDDFGRFREREMLGDLLSIFPERHENAKTVAVETSGEIVASGVKDLDSSVETPFELVHRLAESDLVRQSFVRHAFRFWMGRNETLDDSPTLMAADRAYVDNGGSMKAMIASLLSSDSFLYRREIEPVKRSTISR